MVHPISSEEHAAAKYTLLQHPKQLHLARPVPFADVRSLLDYTQRELLDPSLMAKECLWMSKMLVCNGFLAPHP